MDTRCTGRPWSVLPGCPNRRQHGSPTRTICGRAQDPTKELQRYLGVEETGKELILYAVGDDALTPLKKLYIGFGDTTVLGMIDHLRLKTAIKMTTAQKHEYRTTTDMGSDPNVLHQQMAGMQTILRNDGKTIAIQGGSASRPRDSSSRGRRRVAGDVICNATGATRQTDCSDGINEQGQHGRDDGTDECDGNRKTRR